MLQASSLPHVSIPQTDSSSLICDHIERVAAEIKKFQSIKLAETSGNSATSSSNHSFLLDVPASGCSCFSTAKLLLEGARIFLQESPPNNTEAFKCIIQARERAHYSTAERTINNLLQTKVMDFKTWQCLNSVLMQYERKYSEQHLSSPLSLDKLPIPPYFDVIDTSQKFLQEAPQRLVELHTQNAHLLHEKKISPFHHLQICNLLARAQKYADKPLEASSFKNFITQAQQLFEASQFIVNAPAASIRCRGFDALSCKQVSGPINDNNEPAYYWIISRDKTSAHQICQSHAGPYAMSCIAAAMWALPDPLGRHDRIIGVNNVLYGLDFVPLQNRQNSLLTKKEPTYLLRLTGPNPLGEAALSKAISNLLNDFRFDIKIFDQHNFFHERDFVTDISDELRLDHVLARVLPYDSDGFSMDESESWEFKNRSGTIDLNALRPTKSISSTNCRQSPADSLHQVRQIVRNAYNAVARESRTSNRSDPSELKSLVDEIAGRIDVVARSMGGSKQEAINLARAQLRSVLPAALAVESYTLAFKNQMMTPKKLAQLLPRNSYARAAILTLGHVTPADAPESPSQSMPSSQVTRKTIAVVAEYFEKIST